VVQARSYSSRQHLPAAKLPRRERIDLMLDPMWKKRFLRRMPPGYGPPAQSLFQSYGYGRPFISTYSSSRLI
jgi:hypothetical protein